MPRTIKRVAHDLLPLSEGVAELSEIIVQLFSTIRPHVKFEDHSISNYFESLPEALVRLTTTTNLIKKYVLEVNDEADKYGVLKD